MQVLQLASVMLEPPVQLCYPGVRLISLSKEQFKNASPLFLGRTKSIN